jgi:7,8-dihydropterin-6-yl-methyl-4-(beta-D-ribofuranosyl)aminobenzene 5'-phosphate synthase
MVRRPLVTAAPLASALALLLGLVALAAPGCAAGRAIRGDDGGAKGSSPARAQKTRIVILSTMLADTGIGEWGFSALVEVDGSRILFDTGYEPDTVIRNARALSIDLSGVEAVILSHHHDDHTGGLVHLREELAQKNPKALATAHVGKGIFASRRNDKSGDRESNPMLATKARYEALGGAFVEHDAPVELAPGVWLTGPVPRRFPERNWSGRGKIATDRGLVEDDLPEDQSLVIDTDKGLVVLSGCGHAGIINTLELARERIRAARVHAAIGGFHLFSADDATLDWTAGELRRMGLMNLVGAHCTGIEAVYRLRARIGLARETCVVGAVGASFDLSGGIHPGDIAK